MFDTETAKNVLQALESKGFMVSPGLESQEIAAIESALGQPLPNELRALLEQGVPLSPDKPGLFPDWHSDPTQLVQGFRNDIEQAFVVDIQNDQYWHGSFGDKPSDTQAAVNKALEVIRKWPPLVRIHAHRFMPTQPDRGAPVLSVWQASDTIYYGYNFTDYLNKEFSLNLAVASQKPIEIPFWSDALDLAVRG